MRSGTSFGRNPRVAKARGAGQKPAAMLLAVRSGRQPILWRSLAGWAEVASHLGDTEGARAAALRAREAVERIAAGIADERLRATFLQSARVQRLSVLANL